MSPQIFISNTLFNETKTNNLRSEGYVMHLRLQQLESELGENRFLAPCSVFLFPHVLSVFRQEAGVHMSRMLYNNRFCWLW